MGKEVGHTRMDKVEKIQCSQCMDRKITLLSQKPQVKSYVNILSTNYKQDIVCG